MRFPVAVVVLLLLAFSAAVTSAQPPYYLFTFDAPPVVPPGGAATYSITGVLSNVGAGGSAAASKSGSSPLAHSILIDLYQSVAIASIEVYLYNSLGGNSCIQLIWNDSGQGGACRWGTGYVSFVVDKVAPPSFRLDHAMIGFGGTHTVAFDDLRIYLASWSTPTPSPTPTLTPTPTAYLESWLPTRAALLPLCPSTSTPGPSPTRLVEFTPIPRVLLGGTIYRLPTFTYTPSSTSTGSPVPTFTASPTASPLPTSTPSWTPLPTSTPACIPRHEFPSLAEMPPVFDFAFGSVVEEQCLTFVPYIDIPQTIVLTSLPLLGDVTFTVPFFGGLQVNEHRLCFRYRSIQFTFMGADMTWAVVAAISIIGIWFILVFRKEL